MVFQKKNGYIYILSNPAFADNLLKIGMTTRTPEERAREIYETHTGVPFKFKVEYKKMVGHCEFAEEIIHNRLFRFRTNNNREFFNLCSTVMGSFFQDFVKIFNKIRADVGPEPKTCGHTNLNFIIDNHKDTCLFNGHVCTQHKT